MRFSWRKEDLDHRLAEIKNGTAPRADIVLTPQPVDGITDYDAKANPTFLRNSLLAIAGGLVVQRLKDMRFDTTAMVIGGYAGLYAERKFPGALASILPDLPEPVSYIVYTTTGAITGRFIPRGVGSIMGGVIRGYNWFKSEVKIS